MTWADLIEAARRGEDHIIYPGGEIMPVAPRETSYSLVEVRQVLGYELIEVAARGDGWLLIVDEEGKCKPETISNPVATRIYRHAIGAPSEELPSDGTPRMHAAGNAFVVEIPVAGFEPNEIVGAALICASWRLR
jgi:hypothetical protein